MRRIIAIALVLLAAGCETSVRPGINQRWMSDEVGPLITSLESESREIFAHREALAAAVAPAPGSDVADVGAGSGFMVEQFARLVGPEGTVYAVDINASLMDHVAEQARQRGLANVRTVVCSQRSVHLPPASVDLVFICDTYHHFEYPRSTLHSIHEALRPGGEMVVVEFRREPGVSRRWVLDHVRAGRDVVVEEITRAGFALVTDHDVPQLAENYVLRFRRVP